MERTKRQRQNSYADDKQKKLKNDPNRSSKTSCTHFEDIPSEIIYDIFEFLDVYHMYTAFFNLNIRFQNLLTDSNLSIKINLSLMSRSTFEHQYKHIIRLNKHRISSLRLSNLFTIDMIFSPIRIVSKLTRLQTLHINNIESKYVQKLLKYLVSLSCLSSLIIVIVDCVENKNKLYSRIFRLPVLKYCKVTMTKFIESEPLSIAINKYSSIEHLVINNGCYLDELISLLSYVPQLRHISLHDLYGTFIEQTESHSIVFNYLTHISINKTNMTFDELELLIRNHFPQIQRLYFSKNFDNEFLNANRWERLISSYMLQLRIFDFHCISSGYNQQNFQDLLDHFNSPFWIERQWFFTHHIRPTSIDSYNYMTIFSTNPYRRKYYTIYGENGDKYCSDDQKINLNTVHFVRIENIKAINDCNNYFPNVTELTLICKSIYENQIRLSSILNSILPLKQLTKLIFDIYHYRLTTIIELLYFTSNIHTLVLNCTSLCEASFIFILQYNKNFQLISKINKIFNLIILTECTFEVTKLLVNLCPQLQYLTINIKKDDFVRTLQFLLSKDSHCSRHLFSVCLQYISKNQILILNELIKSDKLFSHCFMKVTEHSSGNVYLWW
ncbi:unnamed protein product [Rotaria sordida]|uniref:F-box domain-containing protein n=1 Tax=Rotaria sordida TaxID=392033 RepID=A0A815IN41_9BILA|nr:unnamed protein product [Rotaria sordida]